MPHQVEGLPLTAKQAAAHVGIGFYRMKKAEYFSYSHQMLGQYLEKSVGFSYKTAFPEGKSLDSHQRSEKGRATMSLPDLAQHKRTEELYGSVVELAPDSITTVDIEGVVTSSNSAATRILGYSKDELIGKHFSKIGVAPARDIPKFPKLFNSTLRGEVAKPLELPFYRKDGTPLLAEVHADVLKEGGKTIGLQAVSRDITERKRAEEGVRALEVGGKLHHVGKAGIPPACSGGLGRSPRRNTR